MKRFYFLSALVILFSGCGTSNIYFDIPAAPIKSIHPGINSILLVDRTADTNRSGSLIEGILTGEGFDQDQKNKQNALLGTEEQLRNSGRFNVIRATEILKGSKNGEVMSPPLNFEEVQALCAKYKVDAVLAMELYDSDFIITHGMKTAGGLSFYAEGVSKIDIGFRMYDGLENNLLDEYSFTHSMKWNTGGNSIQDAVGALLSKNEATKRISYDAGVLYAKRLTPTFIRIQREYYNKGAKDLEYGARMMEANNWEKAKEILIEVEKNSPKWKDKGKAAHNMAVINEILGNLEKAKEWASLAWGKYEAKASEDYGYQLTRRINAEQ